ncbi:MAG: IclR family transcriptional regulator [Spirochaetota bacterium]
MIKASSLLEFIAANQPVQPSTICKGLGLTRANVHRLLATLVHIGYVEKTDDGYQLSFKLFQLGSTVPVKKKLRDLAKSKMYDLEKVARENIYLTVLSDDVVIAIEEVKSSHHVVLNPDVTYTYPVNTCASGKLLLSCWPQEKLDSYLRNLNYRRRTDHSITDPQAFKQAVQKALRDGYATEILEFADDLNSVAAPIYNEREEVMATVSISGPAMRLTEEKINELIEPLKDAAKQITEKMVHNASGSAL